MLRAEVAAAPSALALVLTADQPTKTSVTSPGRLQRTAVFTTGASHVSWRVITDPRPAFLTCIRCQTSIRRSNLLVYNRILTNLVNFQPDQASDPIAFAAVLGFRLRATYASIITFSGSISSSSITLARTQEHTLSPPSQRLGGTFVPSFRPVRPTSQVSPDSSGS